MCGAEEVMEGLCQQARQRYTQARVGDTGRHLLSRVSVSAPGLRGEGACVAVPIAVNRPASIGVLDVEADRRMHHHGGRLPSRPLHVKRRHTDGAQADRCARRQSCAPGALALLATWLVLIELLFYSDSCALVRVVW
jgi:hypothetical protein